MKQKIDSELFAQILGKAVHYIAATENKSIKIIQDELGYALGRSGGSAIDYWRRGHVPEDEQEIEQLARDQLPIVALDRLVHWTYRNAATYSAPAGLH